MDDKAGAVVDFVDDRYDVPMVHTVRKVRINGVSVPIRWDYEIVSGGGNPTSIKMEMYVSEIHFVHEEKATDRDWVAPFVEWVESNDQILDFGVAHIPELLQRLLETYFNEAPMGAQLTHPRDHQ